MKTKNEYLAIYNYCKKKASLSFCGPDGFSRSYTQIIGGLIVDALDFLSNDATCLLQELETISKQVVLIDISKTDDMQNIIVRLEKALALLPLWMRDWLIFGSVARDYNYALEAYDDDASRKYGVHFTSDGSIEAAHFRNAEEKANLIAGMNLWLSCFNGYPVSTLKEYASMSSRVTVAAKRHLVHMRDELLELDGLRGDLLKCVNQEPSAIPVWVEERLNSVRQKIDFSDNRSKHEYCCSTLCSVLAVDYCALNRVKKTIRTCGLCGRPFVAVTQRSEYCDRPNSDYKNQPCKVAAKRLADQEKLKLDPVERRYNTKNKSFIKWANDAEIKMNDIVRQEDDKEGKKERQAEKDKAYHEITKSLKDWRTAAKAAKRQFSLGEIDEETALESMELPPVALRSETYTAMLDTNSLL